MTKKKDKYKRKGYPYRNRSGMNEYMNAGLGSITNVAVVGLIPNISGTPAETNIKNSYAEGMGNIGNKFPAMGNIIGTEMVLKQTGKLTKKLKQKKNKLF